jgi:hypothetical protein
MRFPHEYTGIIVQLCPFEPLAPTSTLSGNGQSKLLLGDEVMQTDIFPTIMEPLTHGLD